MGSGRPLNSPAHISALYGHSRRNVYFARIGVFSGLGGNLQGGGLYLAYASALYAVPTSIGFKQWRNSKGMGHRYSKVADYGTHVSEIHPYAASYSKRGVHWCWCCPFAFTRASRSHRSARASRRGTRRNTRRQSTKRGVHWCWCCPFAFTRASRSHRSARASRRGTRRNTRRQSMRGCRRADARRNTRCGSWRA